MWTNSILHVVCYSLYIIKKINIFIRKKHSGVAVENIKCHSYKLNNSGLSFDPWGTPHATFYATKLCYSKHIFFYSKGNLKTMLEKYHRIHGNIMYPIKCWSMISMDFDRSKTKTNKQTNKQKKHSRYNLHRHFI